MIWKRCQLHLRATVAVMRFTICSSDSLGSCSGAHWCSRLLCRSRSNAGNELCRRLTHGARIYLATPRLREDLAPSGGRRGVAIVFVQSRRESCHDRNLRYIDSASAGSRYTVRCSSLAPLCPAAHSRAHFRPCLDEGPQARVFIPPLLRAARSVDHGLDSPPPLGLAPSPIT